MARIPVLFFLLPLLLCASYAEEPKAVDADTEELIRQLSSDDFATRNKATEALASRAERIWPRLEQLARSNDLEISQRAKMAMSLPGQRELQAEIDATRRKRMALDDEVRNSEARLNRKIREMDEKVKSAEHETRMLVEQLEKLPEQAAADKRKELKTKKEADAALFNELTKLQGQVEKLRQKYRADCNRTDTRINQLVKLAESGDILKPGAAAKWTAAEWPFERRLSASVSFEFMDTSLDEAIKFIAEASGIPVKLDADPGINQREINLRVTDMDAEQALQWVSRLAELQIDIDREKEKIVVRPSKAP